MKKEEEFRKELLASKEQLEIALARLDSIKEEEESVTLQLAYGLKHVQQDELFEVDNVEEGLVCVREPKENGDVSFFWALATRVNGPLAEKAFLLNDRYDWELGRDNDSRLCLVPIKKEKK